MRIEASAPTRICDAGGWTDTWFAGHGLVVNLAVSPRARARVERARRGDGPQVTIDASAVGAAIAFDTADPPGAHPLLEQSVCAIGVADDESLTIDLACDAPPGASTGTSAAITVALLGALAPDRSPGDIAALAHHVETERAGLQAGIQDQLASAHGGACVIEMDAYPRARVGRIDLTPSFAAHLDAALVLVFLGTSHVSSDVHRTVIAELEGEGRGSPRLERLRACAAAARDALIAHDLDDYAAALRDNTDAQASLHPGIVNDEAACLIDSCAREGALGWKVNGAGGPGGSVAIVCPPDRPSVREAVERLVGAHPRWRQVPIALSPGGLTRTGRGTAP